MERLSDGALRSSQHRQGLLARSLPKHISIRYFNTLAFEFLLVEANKIAFRPGQNVWPTSAVRHAAADQEPSSLQFLNSTLL